MSINISITSIIFMNIALISLFLILLSVVIYFRKLKSIDTGNRFKYFMRIIGPSCIFFLYSSNIFFGLIHSKIKASIFLYFLSLYIAICCALLFQEGTNSIESNSEYYIPPIDKFLHIGLAFVVVYSLLLILAFTIKFLLF